MKRTGSIRKRVALFLVAAIAVMGPTVVAQCPKRDAPCMTDKIFEQCQELSAKGCKKMIFLMSCPYAGVGCGDEIPAVPIRATTPSRSTPRAPPKPRAPQKPPVRPSPPRTPQKPPARTPVRKPVAKPRPPPTRKPPTAPSPCPDKNASCMNEKNFAQCQALVKAECKNLNVMESCPLQFSCED